LFGRRESGCREDDEGAREEGGQRGRRKRTVIRAPFEREQGRRGLVEEDLDGW
jgi:hypothetical protein